MNKLIAFCLAIALTGATIAQGACLDVPEGYLPYYNETSATALAKLVWAEGRGIKSDTEKAAICWTVINRVEAGYGSLWDVITAPNQFAYRKSAPVDPHLYELAVDVLIRWDMEECGHTDVGRVLPKGYLWFTGDGKHNWFRDAFSGGSYWDWSWRSPYGG